MKTLNLAAFAVVFAALLIFSQRVSKAAFDGLFVSATILIPSVFPLSVVSGVIIRLNITEPVCRRLRKPFKLLFGVSKNAALPFALGMLGGYPLGALSAADMYKNGAISKSDLERLMCFCSNCSPAFIFGVAAQRFSSVINAALILYGTHIISAVITGIIFSRLMFRNTPVEKTISETVKKKYTLPSALTGALEASAAAMLRLAGYIAFFYIVNEFILSSGMITSLEICIGSVELKAVLAGLFEFSTGVINLGASPGNLSLAAFIIGFGGLAVTAQTASALSQTGVKIKNYLLAKLLQGILAYFIVSVILLF